MSMSYLVLIIISTVIGLGAQFYVNNQIKKYQSVPTSTGLSGQQAAANMLAYHNVTGVPIKQGQSGEDFFDPRSNSITIDPDAYGGRSITALATACHEVGHACQYAKGYTPMKIRSAIVPVVNFASNAWMILLIAGIFLNIAGLIDLAIIMYAFAVIFQIVTLPVEFNASHRAMDYLEATGLPQGERAGAFSVLRACALTYVAAALVSVLQLLWLLGQRE
jgi:Zn-dependent membrane protease YugP